MTKLYLRDVGSHPERDLEVTLFPDGELQFEADNGKYVHLNIAKAGVEELLKFLVNEIRPTKRAADRDYCTCPSSVPRYDAGDGWKCHWCKRPRR